MFKHYRWAAILLVAALPLLMASKGCDSGHVGVTSGGAAIMYGDPPADTTVRPIGVAVQGRHLGNSVWIAAAAAAGAGSGALTAKAIRAVGNDPLSMTGDPCQNEPGDKKIAAWRRTSLHARMVFLDCNAWEIVKHYSVKQTSRTSIGTVLRCITKVISVGEVTPGIGQAAKYVWNFPPYGLSSKGGTATILTDENGRITSVYVDGRWQACAGVGI